MENYFIILFLVLIAALVGFFFGYRNKPQNSETGLDEIYKKIEEESLKWDERYKPVKDLSTALKGGTRRGKLGEIALEVLLENAQLPKNIVFERNKRFEDDNYKVKEPDFIINLPDERKIVIDCKFSFDDWDRYNRSIEDGESKSQTESYHKEYIRSIKKMIDDTNEREYHKLPKIKTIDSTIIYFPLANTFESFEDRFQEILEYAQKKNVLLANPTIILYIINIVKRLWSQEIREKNNDLVKTHVEKIYDQIANLDLTIEKNIKNLENVTEETKKIRGKLRGDKNSIVELAKRIIDLVMGTPKKKMDD